MRWEVHTPPRSAQPHNDGAGGDPLVSRSTKDPGKSTIIATAGGPLLVSNGTQVWETNPENAAIEHEFTAVTPVTTLATSPTGALLYESSRGAGGSDLITEYQVDGGRQLAQMQVPYGSDSGGSVVAGPGVAWTSFRGGMAGGVLRLTSHGLGILPTPPSPKDSFGGDAFGGTGGVSASVSDGVLLLHSDKGFYCANPATGSIRGDELNLTAQFSNETAEEGHIYAAAPPPISGILEISPPASCFEST